MTCGAVIGKPRTAPAFLGTYHFEFAVPSCGSGTVTVPVDVNVISR